MTNWSLSFTTLVDDGRPYKLPSVPPDAPAAFAVRLKTSIPGSVPHPDGGFVAAFGNACTHMGCLLLQEPPAAGDLDYGAPGAGRPELLVCGPCPCHGTTFDLTRAGLVIQGPATQNLPQLAVRADGGYLVADGWINGTMDPRAENWPV
jgi:arsenite oxidase small subunit